jgi:Tfp pilus tip-associated adhesin PilY1
MKCCCFHYDPLRTAALAFAFFAFLAAAFPGAARGDDRDLLRDSVGEPYVFIIFDTSGSMNWSPKCTQAQFDAGECRPLCPTGDCYIPLQADDPGSKFFLAKQALYEVLQDIDDVQFGFATYNQDGLRARAKHWLYQAAGDGVDVPGWGPFPAAGAQDVFGRLWNCDTGANDHNTGCNAGRPADLTEAWELGRMQRLAKGGRDFDLNVDFYIRQAGVTYRVRYDPVSGSYGSDLQVSVEIERCDNGTCSDRTAIGTRTVTFQPLGEFLSWDNAGNNPNRANPQLSYFTQDIAADPDAGNTCAGWDPNTDTTADQSSNYSLRWPTDASDGRGPLFHQGDVIPLDWRTTHRDDILRRLAPNTALDATAVPDFSIARYLADERSGAETFLRLENENARPLFAEGSTPLGNSIREFRTWYAGCSQGSCPQGGGWSDIAASEDPDWGCRRKFLLVITDGDETCSGADACSGTAALFSQEGIKTYVVAFGVENTAGNRLTCMAANGGSGSPIFPQNKDELVQALASIFGQIREETSAFASAAVPSVQAEVADRIYLSSFTPLNSASVWDGHLDAYLKPLPLTVDGRPDRSRLCSAAVRSSCRLWDAGEALVSQAPTASDLAAAAALDENVLRLGPAPDERRVFYTKAGFGGVIPRQLRLFSPPGGDPATDPEWSDLWSGLRLPLPTTTAEVAPTRQRTETIIARTLAAKTATVERLNLPSLDITYVLGDIFHADPLIIDRPNDFSFFSVNLYGDPGATSCANDPGYRCYAEQHRRRRKMLAVGSNDGQLHFFDAGIWNPADQEFSDGTGREIFSYVPRLGLPVVRELAEQNRQIFGVDATPRVDDVFIDPVHAGTPTVGDRRWRTVVIGGFREGGKRDGGGFLTDFVGGYYALDVTQPDQLAANGDPTGQQVVPSCLSTQNQTVAGCGPLPFPAVLWEFTDSITTSRLDEDQNGFPDLGETWSVATIGRIRVIEDGAPADKFVAIFGGGMDAENKPSPKRGNWLYMVDIETGQAIYKRPLVGSAPADPAVVDVDLDGYLDTIYMATTAGFLYKVEIGSPGILQPVVLPRQRALPALAADATVPRITDSSWDPFPIFDTIGCPLYFAPTAFYVARLNRFALAFGCGDRENLWEFGGREGRFYVIVDDRFSAAQIATGDLPHTEIDYQEIAVSAGESAPGADFVLNPASGKERGWFLRLDADERVITQTFGLSGILIFSSFQPQVVVTGDPGTGPGGGRAPNDPVCARGGDSRIFLVYANNANSVMSIDGQPTRFRVVPEFVTSPYVEQGATKNPSGGSGSGGGTEPRNSEQLDDLQRAILQALKERAPEECKFGNYWFSVSAIRSDVGHERYATIPICIVERNWKEY